MESASTWRLRPCGPFMVNPDMLSLPLTLSEAANLSAFLTAYASAMPSHLKGAIPVIRDRLDVLIKEALK